VERIERNSPDLGSGGRAVDTTHTSAARLLTRDPSKVRALLAQATIVQGSGILGSIVQRTEHRGLVSHAQRQVRAIAQGAMVSHSRVVVQVAGCAGCAMHELCKATCATLHNPVAQSVGGRLTSVAGPAPEAFQPKSRQIMISSLCQAQAESCA